MIQFFCPNCGIGHKKADMQRMGIHFICPACQFHGHSNEYHIGEVAITTIWYRKDNDEWKFNHFELGWDDTRKIPTAYNLSQFKAWKFLTWKKIKGTVTSIGDQIPKLEKCDE